MKNERDRKRRKEVLSEREIGEREKGREREEEKEIKSDRERKRE